MGQKFNINSRTITAPLAAFCMAAILFVYSRTSIQAAKSNAQRRRDDDSQLSWHHESLRRHGKLEGSVEPGMVGQLAATLQEERRQEKTKTVTSEEKDRNRRKENETERIFPGRTEINVGDGGGRG